MPPEVSNLIAAIATLVNTLNESVGLPSNLPTGRDLRYNDEKTRISSNINLPIELGEVDENDKTWNTIAKIFTNTQLKSIPPVVPLEASQGIVEKSKIEKETIREISSPIENNTAPIVNVNTGESSTTLDIKPLVDTFSSLEPPVITTQQIDTEPLISAIQDIPSINMGDIEGALPKPSFETIVNIDSPEISPSINIPEMAAAPVTMPAIDLSSISDMFSAPTAVPDIDFSSISDMFSVPTVAPETDLSFIDKLVSKPIPQPVVNISPMSPEVFVSPNINVDSNINLPSNDFNIDGLNAAFNTFAAKPLPRLDIDPLVDAISNIRISNNIQPSPSILPSFNISPNFSMPSIENDSSIDVAPIQEFLETAALNSELSISKLSDNLSENNARSIMVSPQISVSAPVTEKVIPALTPQLPPQDDTYNKANLVELKAQTQLLMKIADKTGVPSQQISMAAPGGSQSYNVSQPPQAGSFYTPIGDTMLNINNVGQIV